VSSRARTVVRETLKPPSRGNATERILAGASTSCRARVVDRGPDEEIEVKIQDFVHNF